MNKIKRLFMIVAATGIASSTFAQFDESGIAAGFFDSSKDKDINFSQFHLPPLAVLLENAKSNPQILSLEKARQIAVAKVADTKRNIFSHISDLPIFVPFNLKLSLTVFPISPNVSRVPKSFAFNFSL